MDTGFFDGKATRGQRRWFKKEKKLPHRGYLPSPGGMPPWMASEEDCDLRWGSRKGKNGYKILKSYPHYERMKKRFEEVHQRPMGNTVPVFFAVGWVAEEKFGADAVDWATFACWKANNQDGPFEELQEREARVAEDELLRIASGNPKLRGRPSRDNRRRETPHSLVHESSAPSSVVRTHVSSVIKTHVSSDSDIQVGGPEVWSRHEFINGKIPATPVRPWSTKRKELVTAPTSGDDRKMLPPKKRGGAAYMYVEKNKGGQCVGSDLGFTIAGRRGKPGDCDGKNLAATSLVWRERRRPGGSPLAVTPSAGLGAPTSDNRGKSKVFSDFEGTDFFKDRNDINYPMLKVDALFRHAYKPRGVTDTDGDKDSRKDRHGHVTSNKTVTPDSVGWDQGSPTGGESAYNAGKARGGANGDGDDGGDDRDDHGKKYKGKGGQEGADGDDGEEEDEDNDDDDGVDGVVAGIKGKERADIHDDAMYEPPPGTFAKRLRTSLHQRLGNPPIQHNENLTKLEMWEIQKGLRGGGSGGSSNTSWVDVDPPKWSGTRFDISGSPPVNTSRSIDDGLVLDDLTESEDEADGGGDSMSNRSVQWRNDILKGSPDSSTGGK